MAVYANEVKWNGCSGRMADRDFMFQMPSPGRVRRRWSCPATVVVSGDGGRVRLGSVVFGYGADPPASRFTEVPHWSGSRSSPRGSTARGTGHGPCPSGKDKSKVRVSGRAARPLSTGQLGLTRVDSCASEPIGSKNGLRAGRIGPIHACLTPVGSTNGTRGGWLERFVPLDRTSGARHVEPQAR